MKRYVIVILVLSLALFVYGCSHQTTGGGNTNQQVSTPTQTVQEIESNINDQPQITQSTTPEQAPVETPKTYSVDISNFAFSPKEIRIKKGDTIIWTNKDSTRHTVTSDSGNELGSELLSKGSTYSHTFSKVGTFSYHCTPHPAMKARIIVE